MFDFIIKYPESICITLRTPQRITGPVVVSGHVTTTRIFSVFLFCDRHKSYRQDNGPLLLSSSVVHFVDCAEKERVGRAIEFTLLAIIIIVAASIRHWICA